MLKNIVKSKAENIQANPWKFVAITMTGVAAYNLAMRVRIRVRTMRLVDGAMDIVQMMENAAESSDQIMNDSMLGGEERLDRVAEQFAFLHIAIQEKTESLFGKEKK